MKNIWIFNNAGNSCGVFIFFFFGNEQEFVIIDSIFVKMLSSMLWGTKHVLTF